MGSLCSNIEKDDAPGEKDGQGRRDTNANTITRLSSKRLRKLRRLNHHTHHHRHQEDIDMAQNMIEAHDKVFDAVISNVFKMTGDRTASPRRVNTILDQPPGPNFDTEADYIRQREEILKRENTLSFDFRAKTLASKKEQRANAIIQKLKVKDKEEVYDKAEPRQGRGGQNHPRFAADHFLSNVDLINQTSLFRVAVKMPKGAHLHIHFNACLQPHVLLGIAATMSRMFINSDLSLAPSAAKTNLQRCEIQFSILSAGKEKGSEGNLFDADYADDRDRPRKMMKYSDFILQFPKHYNGMKAEEWLTTKLVFHEDEAHNELQTAQGAWEKFNGRTRMMKGLFNYEKAYREYTRGILEDFVRDNIQYAEIRPNFMKTNQLWSNEGTRQIGNEGIMEIIIDEYKKFQKETKDYFGGLKVIYCTPRSFPKETVAFALDECLRFKQKWPEWIAGFDLVGEESQGHPLRYFIKEFLAFRKKCEEAVPKVDIPFLFHCGETTDIGNETDGNLVDALLLNSKRIGHGFALARHPYIMEHMKKRGICLEVCPISNEELGLTPRITGHSMYNLLANNVHCTLNSDNGTIFRSTLSHDFYQAMVGKTDMTLYGWRQLIEWSLEHSCMSKGELKKVREEWENRWGQFLDWILAEFKELE
ncbi:adenosine/AMP deaminase [Colletotrichum salicis]|uniref:adenosine deaminase n=1 Tax=Colletotrichum salicis TaxID=1209931 RepID=A0A135UZD8_9PEZI|nr:adenosine/AMP deaminase [Colletotrichum salicis]